LKKFLFVLFIATAIFAGCKKDSSTKVDIGPSDLAAINGELKGMWLFPSESQKIVNSEGKTLSSAQNTVAPALQFDGSSTVTIYQDIQTKVTGTYALSTKQGLIYLDIYYPNGTDVTYQVVLINSQTLKLVTDQPYVYYSGATAESAINQTNLTLSKQSSADVTGKMIRVTVNSDSIYSVAVYVTHTKTADTAVFLDSRVNTTGNYSFAFPVSSGDQLSVDVVGNYTNTFLNVYYNGVPMAGNVGYDLGEFKTTTGWVVP
jgi:hypothetical protein